MAKIPVLFMCDRQSIASECEQGSTAEALKVVCSSLFPGLSHVQSLQSFDNSWDEWVDLPSDFTLQSRAKLKVVARNRAVYAKPKTKRLQATLQTSYGNLSVDKNNAITDKPAIAKYIFPNPHTERLKYYNKATEEIFHDYDDFPTSFEFKNYVVVERKWRYELTTQLEKLNDSVEATIVKENSGFAQRTATYRKVPTNISSMDLQKCKCTLQDLEKINSEGDKLEKDIMSKKKKCYYEDMTLRPGGEDKLNFLDSSMEKLSGVVAVVKKAGLSDVHEVYKVISEHVSLSGKGCHREKKSKHSRREKEQRRKNKQKKENLIQRQANNVLKELVVEQASLPTDIDITQMVQFPLITAENINMEALKGLKRRFHLNGLKHLVKNNYIGEDVLLHVNKCTSEMEATAV